MTPSKREVGILPLETSKCEMKTLAFHRKRKMRGVEPIDGSSCTGRKSSLCHSLPSADLIGFCVNLSLSLFLSFYFTFVRSCCDKNVENRERREKQEANDDDGDVEKEETAATLRTYTATSLRRGKRR